MSNHFKAPSKIRPTTNKVREAIFSILLSEVGSLEGYSVLDLFAGSGALGLTALMRGAQKLVSVDSYGDSCEAIRDNAIKHHLDDKTKVSKTSCLKFETEENFNLILADPPYDINLKQLEILLQKIPSWMSNDALFVLELRASTKFNENIEGINLQSKRNYGDTGIWIYKKCSV